MYTLKTKDIPKNFACIYKINYPNRKIYIGRTFDLKRRAYEHNSKGPKAVCDFAIQKYGKITEWEILQDSFETMDIYEAERYWIKQLNAKENGYNISDGGKDSFSSGEESVRAVFSNSEVLDIRKRHYNREKKLDVYKDYNDRNFKSFEKVWQGCRYSDIGKEYSTSTQYGLYAGEDNPSTDLKEKDVITIRKKYYEEEKTQKEIEQEYPDIPKTTINNILQFNSWKYVATEYKGQFRKRGRKTVTKEIALLIKEDVVKGLTLKDLKEKYSSYNIKEIKKVAQGKLFCEIIVENFQPIVSFSQIKQEEKKEIWEEYEKEKENTSIKDFCKKKNISRSTLFRIQKQQQ